MSDKPDRLEVHFHLPVRTIVTVLLTVLVVWAGLRLWPVFVLFLVALVIAVALHPVVLRLERHGISRGIVLVGMAVALVSIAIVLVFLLFTSLADQIARLTQDFPGFRARVEERLPSEYPLLKRVLGEIFALPYSPEVAAQLKRPIMWGTTALSGGVAVFLTLVLILYLLLDGKRLYAWLLAYVPRIHRDRMAATVDEVCAVVYQYVRGQMIISLLFSAYVAIILHAFRVPAALPLAILSGFCDVIPVVGIIIAAVPAILLALAVSPAVAAVVLCLYVAYHAVEVYFIVPKIYGQRLRLSTLAILLALIAGNTLGGLIGAVLVLPLVAAYPIVERIWLAQYLSPEVIKDHKALARSAGTMDNTAVDTVLLGKKHPWEGTSGLVAVSWRQDETKTEKAE